MGGRVVREGEGVSPSLTRSAHTLIHTHPYTLTHSHSHTHSYTLTHLHSHTHSKICNPADAAQTYLTKSWGQEVSE